MSHFHVVKEFSILLSKLKGLSFAKFFAMVNISLTDCLVTQKTQKRRVPSEQADRPLMTPHSRQGAVLKVCVHLFSQIAFLKIFPLTGHFFEASF